MEGAFKSGAGFDPENQQKDKIGGVGLENIRRRLALKHTGHYKFETKARENVFEASLLLM